MNSEQPLAENPTTDPGQRSADDLLPPVSPPSSGFIMQLFVIPLLVVLMIVGIWLLFHWVANRDMKPIELAQDIERLNHASWQKALTLANQLRDPGNEELRGNRELCEQLASQLTLRINEGGEDQQRVWLRVYLCRALGEFELDTGMPALIAAVRHQQSIEDVEVRRAALQSIGILVNRIDTAKAHDDLLPAVIDAADATSEKPEETLRYDRLRSTAAFVLGLLQDDVAKGQLAKGQLAKMLDDTSEDVRYNAAVGLARHGDQRCVALLVRMLAGEFAEERPENNGLTEQEITEWRITKRQLVITTALRATSSLLANHPSFDLSQLHDAIRNMTEQPSLEPHVLQEARRVLEQLDASQDDRNSN